MSDHRNVLANPGEDVVVEQISPDQLKLPNRHPRKHSEKQYAKLMASMTRFGVVVPVIVDETGEVVCGVARLEAARRLGVETVLSV